MYLYLINYLKYDNEIKSNQIKSEPSPKSKIISISFSINEAVTLLNKTYVSSV